jgi:hypothetical protein
LLARTSCSSGNIISFRPIIVTSSHPSTTKLPIDLEGFLQFVFGFVGLAEETQGAGSLEGRTRFLGYVCVGAAGRGVGFEGVVKEGAKAGVFLAESE